MLRGDLLRHLRIVLLLAASTLAGALAADFVHRALVKRRNNAAAKHEAAREFMLP